MGRKYHKNDWPGERIQQLRDRLELTQKEFAALLRCDRTTLQKWEWNIAEPSGQAQVLFDIVDQAGVKALRKPAALAV